MPNKMVANARQQALKTTIKGLRAYEELLRRHANQAHEAKERNVANNLFTAADCVEKALDMTRTVLQKIQS